MRSAELGANNQDQAVNPYHTDDIRPVFSGAEKAYPGKDYKIWDWKTESWIDVQSAGETTEVFSSVDEVEPYYELSSNIGEIGYVADGMSFVIGNWTERLKSVEYIEQTRGKTERGEIGEDFSLSVEMVGSEFAIGSYELSLVAGMFLDDTGNIAETISLYDLKVTSDDCEGSDEAYIIRFTQDGGGVTDSVLCELIGSEFGEISEDFVLSAGCVFSESLSGSDVESLLLLPSNENIKGTDEMMMVIQISDGAKVAESRTFTNGYGYFGYGQNGYGGITYG